MIALVAAATVLAGFNCEVQPPQTMKIDKDQASLHVIGFPPELQKWKFSVRIEEGDPLQATVDWPGDPFQSAGTFPAITTSEGSYAFTAFSGGPCAFTETACLTLFNLVDNQDETASIVLTPSAIATMRPSGKREPLMTMITGTCSRSPAK